uniref:Uncharacterized protein n=1 Tax=Knipowitschia caucasica TaxID=637954 RepID=A0AAV2JSZ2_KNICA
MRIASAHLKQKMVRLRVILALDNIRRLDITEELTSSKMEMTFSLRRKEIVMEEPLVLDVQRQWPALFLPEQISAEFFRITQTHLMNRFFSSLDEYAPKIIRLYRARAALWGKDMKTLLENLDDQTTEVLAHRKSAALKGLPLIMRDESKSFLRTCLDMQPRENHVGGMKMGVLTIVEDDVGTVDSIPNARFFTVVLEEQIVIDEEGPRQCRVYHRMPLAPSKDKAITSREPPISRAFLRRQTVVLRSR